VLLLFVVDWDFGGSGGWRNGQRRDKAQLMRDTSDNKKKLIRELKTLRCHSL